MTIGIIGALDEEIEFLKKAINGKLVSDNYYKVYAGKYAGTQIYLVKSNIGKVNGALAVAKLFQEFKVTTIINTGTAGSLNKDVSFADLIVATELYQHDFDLQVFNYKFGEIPLIPYPLRPNKNLLDKIKETVIKKDLTKVKFGTIVTGDQFVHMDDARKKIINNFNNPLACEMEAAGIAQACFIYNLKFIIIRSLSDIIGKEGPKDFTKHLKLASTASAKLVLQTIELAS